MRCQGDQEAIRSTLGPVARRAVTKPGPVFKPMTAMKTASPTVSKTQSAGSGMRPKVGRTDRSHPDTSPIISAPPLAVRLRANRRS